MTQQPSTKRLSGWIQPGTYACGDDLYMRVDGSFAGEQSAMTLCLADALLHGFPAPPDGRTDGRTARLPGNWLELSGSFQPSPIGDEARDPEYAGDLKVTAVHISRRPHPGPEPFPSDRAERMAITVLLAAGTRGFAVQPSA
jgi:hypothetical protein